MKSITDADALAFVKFVDSDKAQTIITGLGSLPVRQR